MSDIKATLQLEIEAKMSRKKHHTKVYIETVQKNDVLCGRGNGVNRHSGNIQLRDLINQEKEAYLISSKKDKKKFAKDILTKIRAQTPPGRFLRVDTDTSALLWYEIQDEGKKGALEKIRQGLREGASTLMETIKEKKTESTLEKKEKTSISPVFDQMEVTSDSNILVNAAEGVYDRKREKESLVEAKFEEFFQNENMLESRRIDEGSRRKKYKKMRRNDRSSRDIHDTPPSSSSSVQSINLDNSEVLSSKSNQESKSSLNGAELVKVFD